MYLDEKVRPRLEAHGLRSYAGFLAPPAGELVEAQANRDIWKLAVGDESYYLKRVWEGGLSAALENYAQGRLAHSKPYREMLHIRELARTGVNLAEVAAAGERLRFGVPVEGFILTREVPGENLDDLYRVASPGQRAAMMRQLGDMVARLHRHGFFSTVRIKDIIRPGLAAGDMVLIDRETRYPWARKPSARRARHALLTSLRRQQRDCEVVRPQELRSFLRAYCAVPGGVDYRNELALLRDLRRQAEKLSAQGVNMAGRTGAGRRH